MKTHTHTHTLGHSYISNNKTETKIKKGPGENSAVKNPKMVSQLRDPHTKQRTTNNTTTENDK